MIDVSELVVDPDFAQSFQVKRHGAPTLSNEGEAVATFTVLDLYGVVQPASQNDVIKYLPEGQRQGNFISIWCKDEVRMGNGQAQLPDIVMNHGGVYRVAFSKNWVDNGYWFAIAQGFVQ